MRRTPIASRRPPAARTRRDSLPSGFAVSSPRSWSRDRQNSRIAKAHDEAKPAQGQRAGLRLADAPVRSAARDRRGLACVSLVSRRVESAGALAARHDRHRRLLLRAVSDPSTLRAAARRVAVRGGRSLGERLVAARDGLVRLSFSIEVGRGLLARMVAVFDLLRLRDAPRLSRLHKAGIAYASPSRLQPAPRRHRRRGTLGTGHREAPRTNTLERPVRARLLRR